MRSGHHQISQYDIGDNTGDNDAEKNGGIDGDNNGRTNGYSNEKDSADESTTDITGDSNGDPNEDGDMDEYSNADSDDADDAARERDSGDDAGGAGDKFDEGGGSDLTEYESALLSYAAADNEEDYDGEEAEPAPLPEDSSTLFVEALRTYDGQGVNADLLEGDLGNTLCGRVMEHYESMGHHCEAARVFEDGKDCSTSRQLFDTPSLSKIFAYACATGGAGLSRIQIHDLHGVLCATENETGGSTPFRARFPSKTGFYKAIRQDKRRTLRHLRWAEVRHKDGEKQYKIVFRDGLV